jgi:hypothetical protein
LIIEFESTLPQIANDVFIAPIAMVIGEVEFDPPGLEEKTLKILSLDWTVLGAN